MEPDPFFWSIDEVVSYLCHASFDNWARSSLPRPDPILLENRLRENYVTGEVLLTEVDKEAVSLYLGLTPLGHRTTIFKAIEYLRSQSTEFNKSANALSSIEQPIITTPVPIRSLPAPPPSQQKPTQTTPAQPASTPKVPSPQPTEAAPQRPVSRPPRQNESHTIAPDGIKRRRLNPSAISTRALNNIPENPRQKRYLCSQKQPVKDVFYKGIESDDDNDIFGYVRPPNASRGQSLFVNKRMQHFLQQVPQPFQDGKEGSVALFPYDKTAAPDEPRYFTLFEENDGVFSARMEEAEKWPQLKEKSALDYLLVKYPPQGDELPLYGDSGSEDYDSDTCRDMDEARDDAKDEDNEDMSNLMPASDLRAIIENFVVEVIEKWKKNKLPIQEGKAWTLWRRSRKNGTVPSDIRRAKAEIAHLDGRLTSWSKGIKSNEYEKGDKGKVLQQCASLEITIAQRELQKWRLSVLELDTCPAKPSCPIPCPKIPRRRFQGDDEESIGSDTDDPLEDDSDFVVPDDAQKDHNKENGPTDDTHTSPLPSSIPSREDTSSPSRPGTSSPMKGPFEDIELVDLTQGDIEDQEEVTAGADESPQNIEIQTPPLNPLEDPKPSAQFPSSTLLDNPAQDQPSPADSTTSEHLPDITDVAAIENVRWSLLVERRDRKRFLAKIVYPMSDTEQASLVSLIDSVEKRTWHRRIREALKAILKSKKGRIANSSEDDSYYYRRMATLYVQWQQIKKLSAMGIPKGYLREAREKDDLYPFYSDLTEILHVEHPTKLKRELSCEIVTPSQKSRGHGGSLQAKDPIVIEDDIDDLSGKDGEVLDTVRATPRKKRKRAVPESREAMESQNRAQQRLEEQATLQRRIEERGIENVDPERKIVSFDDPVIYLHRDIGRCVKEHQVSGIQFMWRELIKDEKNEGCLLAHTMGLGKTMQVISLLITIADASNSFDPKIKAQVPERFRLSRTLVTCPSSLIDNWWEEFAKWTPRDARTRHHLGMVQKVSSGIPERRVQDINAWYTNGGVLLISHELFRRIIHNPARKNGIRPLSDNDFERVKRQLLEGPNIIVADEAHKLKNGSSDISKACSMFKSKSRIALTGSPLSNQLIDYYQMINWISPGYLGSLKQFKAKYDEPIREGLYFDSTNSEYVRSRKKLEVLKKVLEPKVNRAGISVIQSDLPPKVEFVIVIPVTRLQEEAYNQFVSLTMEGKGEFEFTRLWALLSYLTLLCHHPSCFLRKLQEKKKEKDEIREREKKADGNQIVVPSESEPDCGSEDIPVTPQADDQVIETESRTTITNEIVSQFEHQFKDVEDLESPQHSRRTQMVGQIVDESIKAGDKILIFSSYLHTLNYLGAMLKSKGQKYCRLDGSTPVATRQASTKAFSRSDSDSQVYLISTKAGALGLNIIGANRVIIFESDYNPTWEEQAIGRAYRLGQTKEVFVYRFVMGGTFEELIHEKGVFKKNMALRAVDKKNPTRSTAKSTSEFRRPIRSVKKHDLSEFHGKDPNVLDKILAQPNDIHKIILTETLHREDAVQFTPEEQNEIAEELDDERLERSDPALWAKKQEEKRLAREERERKAQTLSRPPLPPYYPGPSFRAHMNGNVRNINPSQSMPPMPPRAPLNYNGPPPLAPDNSVSNPPPASVPTVPTSLIPRPPASLLASLLAKYPTGPPASRPTRPSMIYPTSLPASQPASRPTSRPAPVPPISPPMPPPAVPQAPPPPSPVNPGAERRSAPPPPLPPSTVQPLGDPGAAGSNNTDKGMRGE
ncbi:hypothetical protein FQN49_001090 [Arthroderma sp. PD_2]|nr:hypothetical protein FQN49_001090 [Arthroderma sp. PD_2]